MYKNFCVITTKKIKAENPDASISEVCDCLEKKWRTMDNEEKQMFAPKETEEEKQQRKKYELKWNQKGVEYEQMKYGRINISLLPSYSSSVVNDDDDDFEYDTAEEFVVALENPKNSKKIKKIFTQMINLCMDEFTPEILEKFIKKGLDINMKSKNFNNDAGSSVTALECCCEFRRSDAIKTLLESWC
jgi:hypothetical protein